MPGRLSEQEIAARFADIHPPLGENEALVEAERCLFCFDAPCVTACPTGIDVPMFIRQLAALNKRGAARTILEANIFGGTCARVCPTETLCEEACVRTKADRPVEIGRLQRHATDDALDSQTQFFTRRPLTGRRVAIVGAGPAGLSCAHALARQGHDVYVLEARSKPGGLNEYGIAAYKVTENFAQREVAYITAIGGIEITYDCHVGRDPSLAELEDAYDAVFVATGLGAPRMLDLDPSDGSGERSKWRAVPAVVYIEELRQIGLLANLPVGRRVVVIGGGMTAIDAAVQAKRLGAEDVVMLHRRGPDQMRAALEEQALALTDGVVIQHWTAWRSIETEPDGSVVVEVERTELRHGELRGTGQYWGVGCDQVLAAMGQELVVGDLSEFVRCVDGRIWVGNELQTSRPRVWAGGDCTGGAPELTVTAVEDGKRAAEAICRYLEGAPARITHG